MPPTPLQNNWGQVLPFAPLRTSLLPSNSAQFKNTARPLRIEFPGAVYHVTSRGDRREPIVLGDEDREDLLGVLGQALHRFGPCEGMRATGAGLASRPQTCFSIEPNHAQALTLQVQSAIN